LRYESTRRTKHFQHDYLRDTVLSIYKECVSCKVRTQFTCVKCEYYYSCHWKKEELEMVESETLAKTNSAFLEKNSPVTIVIEQSSAGQHQSKVIDVYGQQIEPICEYRTCHHKFSVHGHNTRRCKCRHAFNYAAGICLEIL
jgi:hypothetical protein